MFKKLLVSSLLVFSLVFVSTASAESVADLNAKINDILVKIKQLQSQINSAQQINSVSNDGSSDAVSDAGGTSDGADPDRQVSSNGNAGGNSGNNSSSAESVFSYTWARNLRIGDSGEDVVALTTALGLEGFRVGMESKGVFGESIASAIVGFQEKYASEILTPNDLVRGTGYVGKATRAKLNALYKKGSKPSGANRAPIISSIDGPSTVIVGQSNTWTIRATDPEGNSLQYKMYWRDTSPVEGFVLSPTFTHTYTGDTTYPMTSGVYHLIAAVQDNAGAVTTLSKTVTVTTAATASQPSVTVLSPNGGEVWQKGTIQGITWNAPVDSTRAYTSKADIYLISYSSGSKYTIALGVTNPTSYKWPVGQYTIPEKVGSPSHVVDDGAYTVQVCYQNTDFCTGSSSYFNIVSWADSKKPSITVTSPNGGESYVSGDSTIYIKYQSANMFGSRLTASLYHPTLGLVRSSTNSIASNSGEIAMSLGKAGPDPVGQYKITLCSDIYTAGKDVCDSSDNYFTLTSGGNTGSATISAYLAYASDNKAGAWGQFTSGIGNVNQIPSDWNWYMTSNLSTRKAISRITVIHNTRGEVWSTGYSRYLKDGTDLYGREEHPYPLVVVQSGAQINTAYDQTIATGPGTDNFKLYGQPESSTFTGGKLVVEFDDNTSVTSVIPASSIRQTSGTTGTGDLIISDFNWSPLNPTVSQSDPYVYVTFTVKNVGSASITVPSRTFFRLYKDYGKTSAISYGGLEIGTGAFTLAPGESKTFTNVTTTQTPNIRAEAGTFQFSIVADASNLIAESNEGNNELSKTITIGSTTQPSVTVSTPAQPVSSTLSPGATRARFTSFTLTSSGGDSVVRSVVAQGTAGVRNILSGVVLLDENGSEVGSVQSLNTNDQVTVGSSITLRAGVPRTFTIAGNAASNIDTARYSGFNVRLSLVGINNDVALSGALPITGATQVVSGVSTTNRTPVISFVGGPTSVQVGQPGTWTVSASDPDGNSLRYKVYWRDTITSDIPQEFGSNSSLTHTFATPGTYNVTFGVRDEAEQAIFYTLQVTVTDPSVQASFTNRPPVITRVDGPTTLQVGQPGTWTVVASDPEDNPKLLGYKVYWKEPVNAVEGYFNTNTFTHTYTIPGTYTLAFAVQDSAGVVVPFAKVITVASAPNQAPVISSIDGPSTVTIGQANTWTIKATDPEGNSLQYKMYWRDTSPVEGFVLAPTFTHTYTADTTYPMTSGVYQLIAAVQDNAGAVATLSKTVTVTAAPTPATPTSTETSRVNTTSQMANTLESIRTMLEGMKASLRR